VDTRDDEPEHDYWQEYKDDVAMGYIDKHGNQLDPPEPEDEEGPYPDEEWGPEPEDPDS